MVHEVIAMRDYHIQATDHQSAREKTLDDTRGTSPAFQELEHVCDGWVNEVLSILEADALPSTLPDDAQRGSK